MKPFYYAVAAVTIDGYIAKYTGHKSDWASKEDAMHLHKMEEKADVLLLARTTYELAKKQLGKKNCVVITRKVKAIEIVNENLVYINPENESLEKFIVKKGYKRVCVLGGRGVYTYCIKKNLLDELWITIEPILFGSGIGLFNMEMSEKRMELISVKKLNAKGTVLMRYKRIN